MARPLKLVVVLSLLLAACGGGSARGPADGVRFQIFGDTEEIAAYRALIEAFRAKEPAAKIELEAVPKQGDHVAKLVTGFAAGSPADLFLINYRRFGQFAARGSLEILGDRIAGTSLREDAFYPQALDAFRFNGKLVCLPQNISSLVVYWNRALFKQFDVEPPKPEWTWDDFVRTAKALTRDTDGDGTVDVYGFGSEPTLVRVAAFVWQAGAEVVDNIEAPKAFTLHTPEAIRALKYFIELRRVHGVAPTREEAESEDYEARFQAGRLGMLLDSRRATAGMRSVAGLDWDVAPLPRDKRAATILHADAYCIAASSPNKDLAMKFVEFALGAEGAAIIARSGRTVPSLRAVAESPAFLDPAQKPPSSKVWLDAIPTIRRLPNIGSWHEIESKADPVVDEWYYGTEAPELLGLEIAVQTQTLFDAGNP